MAWTVITGGYILDELGNYIIEETEDLVVTEDFVAVEVADEPDLLPGNVKWGGRGSWTFAEPKRVFTAEGYITLPALMSDGEAEFFVPVYRGMMDLAVSTISASGEAAFDEYEYELMSILGAGAESIINRRVQ
jgi:hypothetical protein